MLIDIALILCGVGLMFYGVKNKLKFWAIVGVVICALASFITAYEFLIG